MHKVPAKGPAVFRPLPGDERTVWSAPIGKGREIRFRWPGICCGSLHATMREPETIIMGDKPAVKLDPSYVDAYHLDEMMAERALRDAEKQAEQPIA